MCFKFVYHHMKSFAHHVIIYLIFVWMNACIVVFYSILGQFFWLFCVYSTLKYHKSLSSCWLNSAWLQNSCQLIQRDITHSKWISPGKESMLEHNERVHSCILWTWLSTNKVTCSCFCFHIWIWWDPWSLAPNYFCVFRECFFRSRSHF